MDLRQLQFFCAVADEGGFTAASGKVHTVQSNVTMRVRALEEELGRPLFVRHKSGTALTTAGVTMLGYARRILQLVDESRVALATDAEPAGALRIGSMETTAAVRLPGLLTRYRRDFPGVQISLVTGTTDELVRAVEAQRLDAAFVGGLRHSAVLAQDEAFREELVLITGAEVRSLSLLTRELTRHTVLVFRTGCFYRSTLEHWFHQAGLVPGQVLELGTLDGILACVAAGMGVSLLPRSLLEGHHLRASLRAHRLPTEIGRVSTMFIRRGDLVESPALKAFARQVREGSVDAQRKPAQALS
jgi:DNA-binding transcriptional LysR family regulator